MIKTSSSRNLHRSFWADEKRDSWDAAGPPSAADVARLLEESCGKMLGVGTLEIMPPTRDKKMSMEGVECVQVIIPKAKIVALAHVPGQVRRECGSKLRI